MRRAISFVISLLTNNFFTGKKYSIINYYYKPLTDSKTIHRQEEQKSFIIIGPGVPRVYPVGRP
jgi:hypothetical protein